MEEKIKRIVKWSKNKPQGPVSLQLNPTNYCNLKCKFCWQRDYDNINKDKNVNWKEVSTDRYKEILEEAKKIGVREVLVTGGGEPLCRLDILEIMKKIKELGLHGTLFTNGTLFANNQIQQIVEMSWDKIIFSLDGPDAATNDYLRGKGSFRKCTSSIKSFNSKKLRNKTDNPEIVINTVICKKNYKKLTELYELARKLECSNLFFEPIVLLSFKTKLAKELLLDKTEDLSTHLKKSIDLAAKYNFNTNIGWFTKDIIHSTTGMDKFIKGVGTEKNNFKSLLCYQAFYNMVIRTNGAVGFCCVFDEIISNENIKDKSLEEIWFGKVFSEIRESISNKKLFKFCSQCNPNQVLSNIKIREELKKLDSDKSGNKIDELTRWFR